MCKYMYKFELTLIESNFNVYICIEKRKFKFCKNLIFLKIPKIVIDKKIRRGDRCNT